jgi:para-aminobenzoate synthetase component 1
MEIKEFTAMMNKWGQRRVPFLFIVDFEMKKPLLFRLDEIDPGKVVFDINGFRNTGLKQPVKGNLHLLKDPIPLKDYKVKFDQVYDHLSYGDSYLANLTVKTRITPGSSLIDLFHQSSAKYKLCVQDKFLVFSPEIFIQIVDGEICSYPMKGTIDVAIPGAAEIILGDLKELAEHVTIVDLIRNDLSQVAVNVRVTKFRYIDEIKTVDKRLLQVSSEIKGVLPDDYHSKLGDILVTLLPAGSVTGAPKHRTIDIIQKAEGEDRGYYTGVFGYFDGHRVDSGVMIRFIEKDNGKYFYRSGGGITTQSVVEKEYQEIIDKVYVPVD